MIRAHIKMKDICVSVVDQFFYKLQDGLVLLYMVLHIDRIRLWTDVSDSSAAWRTHSSNVNSLHQEGYRLNNIWQFEMLHLPLIHPLPTVNQLPFRSMTQDQNLTDNSPSALTPCI